MLRGGGKKTIAHEGGDLAARAAGKFGLKAVGKGALRAIPLVGTVAGGIYDAVTGWNDTEAQRRAFGLKSGQDPSFQQKAAYTLANVLDMGDWYLVLAAPLVRFSNHLDLRISAICCNHFRRKVLPGPLIVGLPT